MKEIYVVAAIIKSEGKIMCAQRSASMTLSELWEFPGGKIEGDETHQEALKREIKEELELEISVNDALFAEVVHSYDFGRVHLAAYLCDLVSGVPVLAEHKAIKWLESHELKGLTWAPADIPIVEKLMEEGDSA